MKIALIVIIFTLVLYAGYALNYLAQGENNAWVWAGVSFAFFAALLYKVWSDAAKP
ncbi:hypothetical protein [Buttiauxella gaviniae]|jgi:hypothetical protein|uniref:hypothetical protein n=1 Tax=Buttiauxella gaviniae TaxID=82990 RepID=UPI003C772914